MRPALAVLLLVAVGCRRRTTTATGQAGPSVADAGAEPVLEDGRTYAVHAWSFPLDRYALALEDVGMGRDLAAVLERTRADLVVNAGFFGPNGEPVGLAVSEGHTLSRHTHALGGGVLTFDGAVATLFDGETFAPGKDLQFAVQCRPRLVVDGVANVKRDDGKRSERTALCLRDGGKTLEVVVIAEREGGPSLFALSQHLAKRGCAAALNLDGGPSTGAAWRDAGAVRTIGPRAGIRHALVVLRR